jgi:hypothetical protein
MPARRIDFALKGGNFVAPKATDLVIFVITELFLFDLTNVSHGLRAFLALYPHIRLVPTTVVTGYQEACLFLTKLRDCFLEGKRQYNCTKTEKKLWNDFRHLYDKTQRRVLGITRDNFTSTLSALNDFHHKHPDFDICMFKTLFVTDKTNLLEQLTKFVTPSKTRVSVQAVAATLPMSTAMMTADADTIKAIRDMSTEERTAVIAGDVTTRSKLGFGEEDTEKSVPMCRGDCPNRWKVSELFEHFYTTDWKYGRQNPHFPEEVIELPWLVKPSASGDFVHLLPHLYHKCDLCKRWNGYSFYATQWQLAGGSIDAFQKKMVSILHYVLPSVGWSISHCPDQLCRFSQSGIMYPSSENAVRCPGCATFSCTHCHTHVKPGSHHECQVLTEKAKAEFDLQIAMWELQQCECGTYVNKSSDCDHITCKCGRHFCYNCGKVCSQDTIYNHIYGCAISRRRFMRVQKELIAQNPEAESDPVALYNIWKALQVDSPDVPAEEVESDDDDD